jgi:DnaK suppressor protein
MGVDEVRKGRRIEMSDRSDLDLQKIRRALEAERAELVHDSEFTAEEQRPVELDQQSVGRLSRMDALQVQAMAQALEARRQGRLVRIEAALQRLEAGDYGVCEECGDEIPTKRLEIDPAIERCVDCAH